MVQYAITQNPFNAAEKTDRFYDATHLSIGQWISQNWDKIEHLSGNLDCIYRGRKVPVDSLFTTIPEEDDLVIITPRVSGVIGWVIVAVAVAVATYLAFSLLKPPEVGFDSSDPVYSIQGKSNQNKLGSPIERCYGKVRMYPAYAATPYNLIQNNDQYQFQLFCLGHGTIDKSTCSVIEVQNIELEEIELSGGAWTGPFALCGAGEVIYYVEYDIALPQGLYRVHEEDGNFPNDIHLQSQIRQIDDFGNPIGGWITLQDQIYTLNDTNPIRFSLGYPVAQARYEIQLRRIDSKFQGETSSKYINQTFWAQARGFRPSTQNYGDVSLLAVRAKATNNFNDQSSRKINIIGTWKTEVYDGNSWSLQTNRSIVWAFVDIFRATYGAGVSDKYLNLCELMNLDVQFYNEGKTFDWIFDRRTTTWEAAKTVARVGRAVPIPQGIMASMKVDEPQATINQMFTPRNIVKGTLQRQISLAKPESHDGLLIEYTDPVSFLPEQVEVLLGTDVGRKPTKLVLAGSTNRDLAYQEGLYIRSTELKQRENVSFETGLEGRTIKYGDLIGVQHDNLFWGQSGYVKEINGDEITLSKDLTFGAGIHRIILKDRYGGGQIFEVTAGSQPNIVVTTSPLVNDYPSGEFVESQTYSFGELEMELRLWKVVQVQPMGGEKVKITGVNYEEEIYQYDGTPAPPIDKGSLPIPIPNAPTVENLFAYTSKTNITIASAVWQPALGANSYIFQKSLDGVNWEPEIALEGTTYTFATPSNTQTWIRVLGVGASRGAFANWNGVLGVVTISPSNPKNFRLLNAFNKGQVETIWDASSLAETYQVTTYALPADVQVFQDEVEQTNYSFTSFDVEDILPPVRDYRLELLAKNSIGLSETAKTLIIHNDPPPIPSNISLSKVNETASNITLMVTWDDVTDLDFKIYRVWASDTSGFTPDETTLVYSAVSSQFTTILDKVSGNLPDYYFRVAALDVWGDDDANISPEFSLASFGTVFEVNATGDTFKVNEDPSEFHV